MIRLGLPLLLSLFLHLFLFAGLFSLSREDAHSSPDAPMSGGQDVSIEVVPHDGNFSLSANRPAFPSTASSRTGSSAKTEGSGAGNEGGANPIVTEIRRRIERAKKYPEIARRSGIAGRTLVSFRIDPDGRPQEITLKMSSGSEILDQEALATIRRAAPFPNHENFLEIGIRFQNKSP